MAHINQEQRYTISAMLKLGNSLKNIGLALSKDKSVISREIRRNQDPKSGQYRGDQAQHFRDRRQRERHRAIRFTPLIVQYVDDRLKEDLSPEQIAGEARLKGVDCVSYETIYEYVWENKKQGGTLHTHLRNKGRKYRKRGAAKDTRGILRNRRDISHRPDIVDEKKRIGDFEIDTIVGKNHKGAMVTTNDRVSGLVKIRKVSSREATNVLKATVEALYEYKDILHTITADNGKEFAAHQTISQVLDVDFYFARPYHSWERGANENTNGLIRQYFPKKTDFKTITVKQVQEVEDKLNNRPRKRLGYKTPLDIFNQLKNVAFVT